MPDIGNDDADRGEACSQTTRQPVARASIRDVCQPEPALVENGAGDAIIDSVNSHILQQNLPNAQLSLYPDSPARSVERNELIRLCRDDKQLRLERDILFRAAARFER